MSGLRARKRWLVLFAVFQLFVWIGALPVHAEPSPSEPYIYDHAHLLTDGEIAELRSLSISLGEERSTDFIILTSNGSDGKDIVQYVEDFYDNEAPGYDKPHGNAAILAIDMTARDVYLAGFKKAEIYLDDGRLDRIRNKITPDLSEGNYYEAFADYIKLSHKYMGYEPGVNPENLLFKWWFQLLVSVAVGGIVVMVMAYRSGGRVTVNAQTYLDRNESKVLHRHDLFVNETVTKRKKPSSNSSGGGGGGITGGGHSHSGSRGKF